MRALFALLASLLIIITSGCGGYTSGSSGTVSVEPPIVEPVIEPAPVLVAVYYSEDLRNHKCTGNKGYVAFSWTFALGPPSVEMFDNIFKAMFQDIETVDTGPEVQTRGGRKELVELRLSKFSGCDASWPIFGTTVIEITYEAIIWSGEGNKIAQWEGRGEAGPGVDLGAKTNMARLRGRSQYLSLFPSETSYLAALTGVAMRKAAADFVVNFENDPAVRTWVGE